MADFVIPTLGVLSSVATLALAGFGVWRWFRFRRRIETPDRDSLPELRARRDAVVSARSKFPSRLAYQVDQSQRFSGIAAVLAPMVGVIVLGSSLYVQLGPGFATLGGIMTAIGVGVFGWMFVVIGREMEARRLIAEDFDCLERIDRWIAMHETDSLK